VGALLPTMMVAPGAVPKSTTRPARSPGAMVTWRSGTPRLRKPRSVPICQTAAAPKFSV